MVKVQGYMSFRMGFLGFFCSLSMALNAQVMDVFFEKASVCQSMVQTRERIVGDALTEARIRLNEAESTLRAAKKDKKNVSAADIRSLELRLEAYKSEKKALEKIYANVTDSLKLWTDILTASSKKRAAFVSEYEDKFGTIAITTAPTDTAIAARLVFADEVVPTVHPSVKADMVVSEPAIQDDDRRTGRGGAPKKNVAKTATPSVVYKNYDEMADKVLNPPTEPCLLAFDGKDKFTGKTKRETPPVRLFAHTEDFMKNAMQGKDYIVCDVEASWVQGGFYYLNLAFTIQTKEAQRAFGFLDRGTPIAFRMLNGASVNLKNNKTDIGTVDVVKGTTVYRAQVQFSSAEARTFAEADLDVVRVAWSAGYEDYDIYGVDVLANIIKCLNKS